MKLIKISVLTTATTTNFDDFQFLTLLSTKLRNTLAPNPLDKLMELISMEPHIYDLDRAEITDFFFSVWVFCHDHSQITGMQGKGEDIALTPHYHFHLLHRHLDISQTISWH